MFKIVNVYPFFNAHFLAVNILQSSSDARQKAAHSARLLTILLPRHLPIREHGTPSDFLGSTVMFLTIAFDSIDLAHLLDWYHLTLENCSGNDSNCCVSWLTLTVKVAELAVCRSCRMSMLYFWFISTSKLLVTFCICICIWCIGISLWRIHNL